MLGGEVAVARLISSEVGLGLLWITDAAGADVDAARGSFQRARRSVVRARELTHCMLRARDAGFDAALHGGHPALEAWLDAHLGAPADAPVLLSAGAAYFAWLLASPSPLDAMFDVPIALSLLERAAAFDPGAQDGLALMLLGAHDCYVPAPLGGQPARGSQRLRTVAATPGALRRVAMVVDAELCMVSLQDRDGFEALLQAVLADDDGVAAVSPFDAVARTRAQQLLAEREDLFFDFE